MIPLSCLATILIFLSAHFAVAEEEYNDSYGCDAFNYTSSDCLVKGVEVLPFINLPRGVQNGVTTPAACQELCVKTQGCAFFTHIGKEAVCHLKPALSYTASPLMVVRPQASGDYVSGPRTCDMACEDLPELWDCKASTPVTCAMLPGESAYFKHRCSAVNPCGVQGFECCKTCSMSESECCHGYHSNKVYAPELSQEAILTGVESAHHCRTLSITKTGVYWTYISSPTTLFIGGACYMQDHEDDVKLVSKNSTSVQYTSGLSYCPETEAEKRCSSWGTRRNNDLAVAFDITDIDVCLAWCRNVAYCTGIDFKEYLCALKFGKPVLREDDKTEVTHAPASCKGLPPLTSPCIDSETEYLGRLASSSGYRATAAICRDNAKGLDAWSYSGTTCNLFTKVTNRKRNKNSIAGRGCDDDIWPGIDNREATRVLSQLPEEHSADCVLADRSVVGGFIEDIASVATLQTCMSICLSRPDCRSVTYSDATGVCSLHWSVKVAYHEGAVSSLRSCKLTCGDGSCPETAFIEAAPVAGLSQVPLGTMTSWHVKGSSIEFNAPSSWARMAVLILADQDPECFISDLVNAPVNCWNDRHQILPIHLKAQMVVVPVGSSFNGWSNETWQALSEDSTGALELLNEDITIEESNKPGSDHGFFLKEDLSAVASYWPADFTAPVDFANGQVYARFQVLSTPVPTSVKVVVCLTQSDEPPREICSPAVSLPPYTE